ncbi:MAG TPA: peptidoglycan-binding domain-containing protein [Candidatus Paceibacterota bacterium]|nr:peptidoglycan-binding domain-containing protein [Candidatus Paceibacterota bacterium]
MVQTRTIIPAALIGAATIIAAMPLLADAAITSTLSVGSSGGQVTELQQFLAQDPSVYPEGLVTGYYGSLTEAAVEKYQCKVGIVCSGSPSTTGYGQVGPRTAASVNARTGGAGTGTGGTPTTGDVYAPIMSGVTIATSTSSTTATFTWTTNEAARSSVLYGSAWPFLYASAPSASDTNYDTMQTVTLTGLSPHTTYWFVRQSTDANGNVMLTLGMPFTTGS